MFPAFLPWRAWDILIRVVQRFFLKWLNHQQEVFNERSISMLPDLFFGCFKIGGHVKGSAGSITVMACVLLAWLGMATGKQFIP